MDGVSGTAAPDVSIPPIQVLPEGNVTDQTAAVLSPNDIVPTTVTQWAKTTAATTLWSGPNAQASTFTDLPVASFLKLLATGPEVGQPLPVYYVGDGLLRRPGNGWVDSAVVETVEAPAPGQVSSVQVEFFGDGLTRKPGMAWIGRADVGPITPPVPLPSTDVAVSSVIVTGLPIQRHMFASGATPTRWP